MEIKPEFRHKFLDCYKQLRRLLSSSMMESQKLSFSLFLFFLFSLLAGIVHSSAHSQKDRHNHGRPFNYRPSKLFVFGDSYVDTGNTNKTLSESWKTPYGITFPGKPTGRFSDGRVLTDFFAKYLGGKSPIPYRWRSYDVNQLKHGVNFAFGGTGVFDTWVLGPNMTTQIDSFQQLIKDSVYTVKDLKSSVALVSLNGNDYSNYLARNGTQAGLPAFMISVVNQLAVNLKRIHAMGVKKIAVTKLAPLGCFPQVTAASSFKQCNESLNALVNFHNSLLQKAISDFNNGTHDSPFVLLDLYSSFLSVIKNKGGPLGRGKFEDPLKPCCTGISSEYGCGEVDEKGEKKYSLCENPKTSLFWDDVHPTQEGWKALFSVMQASV